LNDAKELVFQTSKKHTQLTLNT